MWPGSPENCTIISLCAENGLTHVRGRTFKEMLVTRAKMTTKPSGLGALPVKVHLGMALPDGVGPEAVQAHAALDLRKIQSPTDNELSRCALAHRKPREQLLHPRIHILATVSIV